MDNQQVCVYTNALLGDGHLKQTPNKTFVQFSSTNESVIKYKANLIDGTASQGKSNGSRGTKLIYTTSKYMPKTSLNKDKAVSTLKMQDFLLWFLDDGTLHQKRGWSGLASHALTLAQNMELQWQLWHCLGIESKLAFDRRPNREHILWWIMFDRAQTQSITPEIKAFAESNNITGLEHKYKYI